jgi:hypothetical protein
MYSNTLLSLSHAVTCCVRQTHQICSVVYAWKHNGGWEVIIQFITSIPFSTFFPDYLTTVPYIWCCNNAASAFLYLHNY